MGHRGKAGRLVAALLLAAGAPGLPAALRTVAAQTVSPVGPPFAEVETAWLSFWNRLRAGDVEGARRYVHTTRQPLFPGGKTPAELKEAAGQMAFCRLEPAPFPLDEEEVLYRVLCQHGEETAETLVGLRRDADGAWRFTTL